MPPVARFLDTTAWPGVIMQGSLKAFASFRPIARVTDKVVYPPDAILMGSFKVFVDFLPVARIGDPTVLQRKIIMGDFTVIVG